jgi:hypothetical protein
LLDAVDFERGDGGIMEPRMRPSGPSPAIVVAVLALVAALAGTALADTDASTSAIGKKKAKKIAKKQINRLAPGLSVAHAETAATADSSASAANAARLGGRGPASFLPAARVRSGVGNGTSTQREAILRWSSMDITVTTDGDANNDLQLCAENDAGNALIGMRGLSAAGAAVGAGVCTGASTNLLDPYMVWRPGDRRTLFLTCGIELGNDLIRCAGVESQ